MKRSIHERLAAGEIIPRRSGWRGQKDFNSVRVVYTLVERMQPGRWYTRPELRDLVADVMPYNSLKPALIRAWRRGLVVRMANIDYEPARTASGKPMAFRGGSTACKWVFRRK